MERGDAQLLAVATIVAGLAIAGGSARILAIRRLRKARGLLMLAAVAGSGVCVLGLLYALYAFSPNAGR